jgi:hypothetical protein
MLHTTVEGNDETYQLTLVENNFQTYTADVENTLFLVSLYS